MKLFENSGVPVLLKYVGWKPEGMVTAFVTLTYICAMTYLMFLGRAIAQAVVAGFPPRRPGFKPGSSQVGFVVAKWRWGRFSPSTSVSLSNLHSTNFSTITPTYHPGLVQ
jgi:hypothetical protein